MALADLLAGLEAEAAEEAARIEAETRAEAERIVEGARAEARTLGKEVLAAGEGELQREAEQRLARARLEAAAVVREAREEAFEAFLTDVRTELAALRDRPGYASVLRALTREGVAALDPATTLRVDPRDGRLARELLSELEQELEIDASLETAGGVEVTSGDGRTARNTLEERLANAEPALRLLFGDMLADRLDGPREQEPERAEA